MKKFTYHKHEIKNIKNLFTVHIVHVVKSFYKSNDPISKNCLKRYVFNPFLKMVTCANLMLENSLI